MAKPLKDEEVEEIIDEYQDVGDMEEVADNLDRAYSTVQKYVSDWKEEQGIDQDGDQRKEGFLSDDDPNSQFSRDPAAEAAEDFEDFLTELDEEMEFGFKDRFVRMKTLEVRRTAQLPNPGTLANELKQYPSGVSNNEEIKWIANLYAEWLNQRQRQGQSQGPIDTPGVPVQGQQQQSPPPGGGGVPVGGQPQPQPQPSFGHQPQQGQGGQQMEQMEMMRMMMEQMQSGRKDEEVEALREEISDLKEALANGSGGATSMTDELKELAEAKETLEMIAGDNGASDTERYVEHFQQQIQQLRQQIQESDGGMDADLSDLGEGAAVLSLLANQGADADTLAHLAEKVGNVDSDPEVQKKKVEKDMKELELKQEEEKWDAIMEGAQQVVGNLGGVLAAEEQPDPQDEQGEDEAESQRLQPVDGEEQEPGDVSPTRERAEELVQAGEAHVEAREQPHPEAVQEPHEEVHEEPEPEDEDEDDGEDPDPQPAVRPVEEGE